MPARLLGHHEIPRRQTLRQTPIHLFRGPPARIQLLLVPRLRAREHRAIYARRGGDDDAQRDDRNEDDLGELLAGDAPARKRVRVVLGGDGEGVRVNGRMCGLRLRGHSGNNSNLRRRRQLHVVNCLDHIRGEVGGEHARHNGSGRDRSGGGWLVQRGGDARGQLRGEVGRAASGRQHYGLRDGAEGERMSAVNEEKEAERLASR
ncbi:hypothetical protein FA95DRAFT_537751 [Auriscalpium vulgare]|uniref:Uncharacterized protein n=1 Tax=Auriscalpium vulgare TaxID=40419 RepID=A0ACB8RGJ4_9AGAM|nr:hypothetical protein FA95DRAFT_537751 [Auriscalpium vulgare]